MKDLSYPNGGWFEFRALYPDKTYAYAEDGWALVLPGNLHFVDAECAHDISRVSGAFRIVKGNWPQGKFEHHSLNGQIPEGLIGEVTTFARQVKGEIEQLRARSISALYNKS